MIADFTCRVLGSVAFLLLGIGAWVDGQSRMREVMGDIRFLWSTWGEGSIYYGVSFDD